MRLSKRESKRVCLRLCVCVSVCAGGVSMEMHTIEIKKFSALWKNISLASFLLKIDETGHHFNATITKCFIKNSRVRIEALQTSNVGEDDL